MEVSKEYLEPQGRCAFCGIVLDNNQYNISLKDGSIIWGCRDCVLEEVSKYVMNLSEEGKRRVRRRLEYAVRKSPVLLAACAAQAVVDAYIGIDDLV